MRTRPESNACVKNEREGKRMIRKTPHKRSLRLTFRTVVRKICGPQEEGKKSRTSDWFQSTY